MNNEVLQKPRLSIVIASHNARRTIVPCLTAIEQQVNKESAEVIVVDDSSDGTTRIIEIRFPFVKLIKFSKPALIPELWSTGIFLCRGDIVAVTTAHCIPADHWVDEILKAHESDYVAVGGAIENAPTANVIDWAIYFCRYSQYMKPFPPRRVNEVPGDNASYKRLALRKCQAQMQKGFWEPFVHICLRKNGGQFFSVPTMVVYHDKSFGFASFLEQRFQHGRHFGALRTGHISTVRRVTNVILAPLIPCLLLARIVLRVLRKRRHGKWLALSLPILVVFLISWSLGEVVGYLTGQEEE
jgi:glycosyltransferase involved in cell wall biosynthesis